MVRAYLAMSLDGFIAGADDDLSWLEPARASGVPFATGAWAASPSQGMEFGDFLAGVGCILMGRRTYDVVAGFDDWPYGDIPMVVATHRGLRDAREGVIGAGGSIAELVARARELAGDRDVYVDGGTMVRTALAGGALEHLIVTVVPTVLGSGVPLFAGMPHAADLTVERVARYGGGLVQVHLACGRG
ncbi:dihydrofolate reductase family protein [Demequina sp.]|uniref:dihydrofolate reductase family protein n=1 Tax=Demequina sp. TaxID=2050685 RepID=UPI0025E1B53C|nr:dihydrofolate reductase family protein [Demequina sp.]